MLISIRLVYLVRYSTIAKREIVLKWNALPRIMLIYSAIHKAAGSLVTSHSQKAAGRNDPLRPFLPAALIDRIPQV